MIAVPQRCGLPHTCEHCAVKTGSFKYFPDRDYNCSVCYAVALCQIRSTHNIGNDYVNGNYNQFMCASRCLTRRLIVPAMVFFKPRHRSLYPPGNVPGPCSIGTGVDTMACSDGLENGNLLQLSKTETPFLRFKSTEQ